VDGEFFSPLGPIMIFHPYVEYVMIIILGDFHQFFDEKMAGFFNHVIYDHFIMHRWLSFYSKSPIFSPLFSEIFFGKNRPK
jgi:hypothetical protein